MGLLDAFGYSSNPFVNWFDQNRNTLTSGVAGLAGASNLHDALTGFTQGITNPGARQADSAFQQAQTAQQQAAQQVQQSQQQQNSTIAWLKAKGRDDLVAAIQGGMPVGDAWKTYLADASGTAGGADPASVAEYKFYANQETAGGRQPLSYADWRKGSNQTLRAGVGQPIWGKSRTTGEYKPFEPMSDGTISSLTDPNADPKDFIFDPGTVASDKAAGTAYGQGQGMQQFNIPAAKQNIDLEMANIDAIANDSKGLDEVFGNVLGVPQQWLPTMPGTPKANAQARISQVVGQNFLQAYASLKGAGAITEVEGAKAQDAMGRLSTAQSKDAFLQALNDLKAVLKAGYDRMSTQTTMGPYQSTGYTPPPLAGQNYQVLSVE